MPRSAGRRERPADRGRPAPARDEDGTEKVEPQDTPRGADWLTWKRIKVGTGSAMYGEAGTGSPVLFLHGWGLDHKVYKRALSRLVATGVRVLAPALPGFGGTMPPVSYTHLTLPTIYSV